MTRVRVLAADSSLSTLQTRINFAVKANCGKAAPGARFVRLAHPVLDPCALWRVEIAPVHHHVFALLQCLHQLAFQQ